MDLKFLVIIRSHDQYTEGSAPDERQDRLRAIQQLKKESIVELALEFIGGGGAYVVCISSTVRLAVLLQTSPLFKGKRREVIPVAEAADYLTEMLHQSEVDLLVH